MKQVNGNEQNSCEHLLNIVLLQRLIMAGYNVCLYASLAGRHWLPGGSRLERCAVYLWAPPPHCSEVINKSLFNLSFLF